jgi:hypothetical protein
MGSKSWKNLEYDAAETLGGKRISRGANFSDSAPDVWIEDFPKFKIDTKRRKKSNALTLYNEIKDKYCTKKGDQPILIIRQHYKKTALAVIDIKLLAKLFDFVREHEGQDGF